MVRCPMPGAVRCRTLEAGDGAVIGAGSGAAQPGDPGFPAGGDAGHHPHRHPADPAGCLAWWTVDLFVDDRGTVTGVTLDLWEP